MERKHPFRFDYQFQLENHYGQVKLVNEGIIKRIGNVSNQDADKNAIVTLHSLSLFLSMEIDYSLSTLEYIFITPVSN